MNLVRKTVASSTLVVAMILGGAIAPTYAATSTATTDGDTAVARIQTSASGSLTCPVGQRLHVAVELENRASIQFRLSGSVRYTSPATDRGATYDYGVRGGTWRVDSGGGIVTVRDYCTGASR